MLGWWYGRGWLWIIDRTRERLKTVAHVFAVSILIRTLFSPWKQIYTGKSTFQTFLRDAVDNAVSRFIGAIVRGSILFGALLLSLLIVLVGLISLIIWPILPFLIIILPILTLSGVTP